jgi:hypothetical protein
MNWTRVVKYTLALWGATFAVAFVFGAIEGVIEGVINEVPQDFTSNSQSG